MIWQEHSILGLECLGKSWNLQIEYTIAWITHIHNIIIIDVAINFCCVVELTYHKHAASVAQLSCFDCQYSVNFFYIHNHTAHHACMVPVYNHDWELYLAVNKH